MSDPDVGKGFKYYAQYSGVMQGSQEGKREKKRKEKKRKVMGPACPFRSKHIDENSMEIIILRAVVQKP